MFEEIAKWFAGDTVEELEGLRFVFNVPFSQALAVVLLLIAGAAVVLIFWPRLSRLQPAPRALLVGLRMLVVVLALFLLLDPCLSGKRVRRTDRAVVLLFDDSRSMQVAGPDGRTRGLRLLEAYRAAQQEIEKELREKSRLVFCRFGEFVERIRTPDDLKFDQGRSDLVGAVASSAGDFQAANLAAVALFSDGVQQTPDRPADASALEDLGVPVVAVGVGDDSPWRDLEVGAPDVTRADFDEAPVIVEVPVQAAGLAGQEVVVEALIDGSVANENRLKIDSDEAEMQARLEFVPRSKGWLDLEIRARPAARPTSEQTISFDRVAQNNSRRLLIDNRDRTYRILYLGGRPNWENKFIRRALEGDEELKLTSLVRISGPEKTFEYRGSRSSLANPIYEGIDATPDMPRYDEALFLRFGAEESELSKGYPQRAEELFTYDMIVWGEIEADFFSQAQMELTREYVRKRGGALLLLGGRHSFAEGGFTGTAIESLLPVRLPRSPLREGSPGWDPDRPFLPEPTLEGLLSGAWSLDPEPDESERLWEAMPPLYRINEFALTRPGATVHAEAVDENWAGDDSRPLFVVQRYGEGRSAVLATDSTWQWRMRAEEDDRRHERLWRQIVRSFVRETPEPIYLRSTTTVRKGAEIVQPLLTTGEPAEFDFIVRDEVFDAREGLNVTVGATAPSAREIPLPVEESIHEAGLYSCRYVPEEPGVHTLLLTALDDQGRTIGTMEQAVAAESDRAEFRQAQYDPAFLRSIADRTGGAFLEIGRIADLPDAIPWEPSEQAEVARIHLWRFPGFYIALVALMIAEWYLRRKRGYA